MSVTHVSLGSGLLHNHVIYGWNLLEKLFKAIFMYHEIAQLCKKKWTLSELQEHKKLLN